MLIAAERFDRINDEDLVERFFAMGLDGLPRAQHFAAELLMAGTGIERDEDAAHRSLVMAAYDGNTEALLDLAEITSDGTEVAGWATAPELTVTLAFGALVGELDARICDRINRIGSAYRLGRVVAQDSELAERWYRLSAALGDYNAAWQVSQLHMEAEGIVKDNAVLLRHLEQAAAGGLPFALNEIGRIHEIGALVPQDLEAARAFYEQAAATGEREGLLRIAMLIDQLDSPEAEDLARRREALRALVALPDAPAWAFVELGDIALEEEGRWLGEAAATDLFEKALAQEPGHPVAVSRLVRLGLRHADSVQPFLDLVSDLQEIVLSTGNSAGMEQLADAYACRKPDGPDRRRADYWRDMRALAGNVSVQLSPREIAAQSASPQPVLVAQVQSQALAGRSPSYALFDQFRQAGVVDADEAVMRSLAQSAETGPLTEAGKAAMRMVPPDAPPPERALELLRRAVAIGERRAETELLKALVSRGVDPASQETRDLAQTLATQGVGLAIETLAEIAGGDTDARRRTWEEWRSVIEADGDFDALVFALPYLDDAQADHYLARARVVMACNLPDALALAEVSHALDRPDEVGRWLDVAEAVVEDVGWQLVSLSDAIRTFGTGPQARDRALALLARARAQGERMAMLRTLSLAAEERSGLTLGAEETADLYVELVNASDLEDVPSVLRRISFAGSEVQAAIGDRVDARALFESAAEAGVASAQLELGRILRVEATGDADLRESVRLLTAAAEQGEAEAMSLLATAYSFGLGVEPSLEESQQWLRRAAAAGDEQARGMVRLIDAEEISQ
ncbi:SEL1-like repeat protein [Jannaschia formosa]|uniref:SEL1-like repeat protein n=1 Tax=Jannaschia formosa TaxID=2259592 RepID=UPI0014307524|nr:SEL1-like repeat protein [Jannaschia formosa]